MTAYLVWSHFQYKKTMGLLLFMTCQSLKSLVGLGDCWLMAALACVAEYPAKLKGLFESKHITEVMGADGCRAKESIFTAVKHED